jgi:diguanylate cyclase (GGDEF)-like protein
MKNKIIDFAKNEFDEFLAIQNPKLLSTELMIGKNLWLTTIRWIYSVFFIIFFVSYNMILEKRLIDYRVLGLILSLSIFGNIIFTLVLKRGVKYPSEKNDFTLFTSLASLQLDFDLIILSALVFFSNRFDSPMIVLYIFYIMMANFLIQQKKAFRNTLTAIILVIVIFFSNEDLFLSLEKMLPLVAFTTLMLFAYFISSYLSGNLRNSEKKLQALLERSQELSVIDGLTNLYNQTHFFLLLRLQFEKSKRYHTPFSLIMFDLDNFKNYNDKNGHLKGSSALQRVGDLMRTIFRSSDILAKYGGDEFAVILPNSDKVGAFLAADRLREIVEEEPFDGRENQPLGKVTLSIGIADFPANGESVEDILNCADKALYFAKNTGRNKTVIYNKDLDNPVG